MIKLPKHEGSLSIVHNPHKDVYNSVQEYIGHYEIDDDEFKSVESKNECINKNEMWIIRWYPNTPVGFFHVAAPTLEEALELSNRVGEAL